MKKFACALAMASVAYAADGVTEVTGSAKFDWLTFLKSGGATVSGTTVTGTSAWQVRSYGSNDPTEDAATDCLKWNFSAFSVDTGLISL